MRRTYLRDCAAGDVVEDVFVVSNKQFAQASNGSHYIKAFISDRTAQLSGRMWKATREIFNYLPDAGFARVRARVENYQSNLQVIIETVGPAADGSYDVGDLLPCTKKDVPAMFAKLAGILGSVRNRHLHAVLQAYLRDERLMNLFRRSPAAQSFHHAWIGGLLEHTLNAVEVGDAVCRFYPLLNRDLVIAGLFVHDIAKTWELKYEAAFSYSDGGQLIGHIVKSAMWLEHKASQAGQQLGEPIPRPLVDVLQHIILSHHGELAFGSPKTPATPEAIAVHMIENMDAKLTMTLEACRGGAAASAEGNWTEYMKMMNGRLYRPDVAPPDMGVHDTQLMEDAPEDEPVAAAPAGEAGREVLVDATAGDGPNGRGLVATPLFDSLARQR
jgi:3'-5' exoribonuclease